MAKRILTAVIWIPILVLGFAYAPIWVIALAIAVLSVVGVYELLWVTGAVKKKRLCAYSCIFAALVPAWTYLGSDFRLLLAGALVLVSICFLDGMLHQAEVTFEMVSIAMFGALIVPSFLSAFLRLEADWGTRVLFALPLVYAFLSDAGGYFVGRFLGKHKLAPSLSPKKTVEGSVGAVIFAVGGGVLFGLVTQYCFAMEPDYLALALLGVPISIVSQFGDLVFSYIKREFGVKDYGKLFLGHGGVLDRFDSVIFAAPTLELLLFLTPVF
jgi:phosphatidate cytidylyltransferase